MLRCLLDTSQPAEELLGPRLLSALQPSQVDHLLALRGLLAHRVGQHALQKRHCVDYGINRYTPAWSAT